MIKTAFPVKNDNGYFTTYYVTDRETGQYVGLIEAHTRRVTRPYYVGWRFEGFRYSPTGKCETKMFYEAREAINYVRGREG